MPFLPMGFSMLQSVAATTGDIYLDAQYLVRLVIRRRDQGYAGDSGFIVCAMRIAAHHSVIIGSGDLDSSVTLAAKLFSPRLSNAPVPLRSGATCRTCDMSLFETFVGNFKS